MYLKRGLIYLVFFLLIPIVFSQSLTCDDGTRFASCKENTNLFCSDRNLILNGGFEADSNKDGIPNLFSKDPNAILGTDLIYSTDALSGLKSILITKQWASFDYQAPFGGAIVLQPSTDYLFFAFVKGNCNNLRVFYSQNQVGTANELCGSNKICNLIPFGSEWKRLITQFNSNEILTTVIQGDPNGTVSQGSTQVPFLSNLRVECADPTPINSTSFRLYVDNMHLQPVDAPPQLIENCQICGSCPSGLFCAPDGSCVNDLSAFYTDEELMVKCIAENNFELCEKIQNPATKPLASNLFATENNDIEKCQDSICRQSVLYFNCIEQGRANCRGESLAALFDVTSGFADGGDFHIKYFLTPSGNIEIEKFKLGRGRDNKPDDRCEVHVRKDFSTGSIKHDYLYYSFGSVISKSSNIFNSAKEILVAEGIIGSYVPPSSVSSCPTCEVIKNNFPWSLERNCGNRDCRLLEGNTIEPKTDLLCGYDTKWHLCDREGIKEFENGEKFICTLGRWIKV